MEVSVVKLGLDFSRITRATTPVGMGSVVQVKTVFAIFLSTQEFKML